MYYSLLNVAELDKNMLSTYVRMLYCIVSQRLGKIARSWAVDTLAITAQQVVQRKRAATARCARKRRMEWAAGVIQQHWKKYIANKRRYEAKAASLISRIRRYSTYMYVQVFIKGCTFICAGHGIVRNVFTFTDMCFTYSMYSIIYVCT